MNIFCDILFIKIQFEIGLQKLIKSINFLIIKFDGLLRKFCGL